MREACKRAEAREKALKHAQAKSGIPSGDGSGDTSVGDDEESKQAANSEPPIEDQAIRIIFCTRTHS